MTQPAFINLQKSKLLLKVFISEDWLMNAGWVTFVWLPVYWISVVVCLIPIHCTKTILESNQTWNSLTTGNSSNLSLLRIVSRHFIITIRSWRSNVYNYCYNNIFACWIQLNLNWQLICLISLIGLNVFNPFNSISNQCSCGLNWMQANHKANVAKLMKTEFNE